MKSFSNGVNLISKIIIVIVMFVAGFYFGGQQAISPSETLNQINQIIDDEEQPQIIKANLMLDFGNGQVRTFNNIELPNDSSVFDLLKNIADQNNLKVDYKDYGEMGALVEAIGDIKNDLKNNLFWQFWVNNKYSEIGSSNFKLTDGDIVEWKFIRGQIN